MGVCCEMEFGYDVPVSQILENRQDTLKFLENATLYLEGYIDELLDKDLSNDMDKYKLSCEMLHILDDIYRLNRAMKGFDSRMGIQQAYLKDTIKKNMSFITANISKLNNL